jgi:hypothetical protein
MNTQPQNVLNFLKFPTGIQENMRDSKDATAIKTAARLASIKSNPKVPVFLFQWLMILTSRTRERIPAYYHNQRDEKAVFHKFCSEHTLQEWLDYWNTWWKILKSGIKSGPCSLSKAVFPEVYKDFKQSDDGESSDNYQKDWTELVDLHLSCFDSVDPDVAEHLGIASCPLTKAELDFIDSFLSDEVKEALSDVWSDPEIAISLCSPEYRSLSSGLYVGHVQHIPKKGDPVSYRDIAVPNRFIQAALEPGATWLYSIVRKLPRDATYDQDRFDQRLTNRVTNENLYAGSVDLSKATDNLPREWGYVIISNLIRAFGCDDQVRKSIDLFWSVSKANWEDEGFLLKWTRGQPLGSLPSFACLALTHNLFVEALSLAKGYSHSPYVILGDDIVLLNKKLRKEYIRQMVSRAIPLSLHKSYEGELVEFAGKTYIRNCVPFHTTDHGPVTWAGLFDWQCATGIKVPYKHLPRDLRRRLSRTVSQEIKKQGFDPAAFGRNVIPFVYHLVQLAIVNPRGASSTRIEESLEGMEAFWQMTETEDQIPDPTPHSGITILKGRPVTLMGWQYADKSGWFMRFRPVQLPDWYKSKFRPVATDALLRAGVSWLIRRSQADTQKNS